ncbi:MAG TPA: hypothetical protein VMF89_20050 [Polyangiales bacterium]|nr:hypothetical protein [Polyangiales bacterium]
MANPLQKYLLATLQLLILLATLLCAGVTRAETPALPFVVRSELTAPFARASLPLVREARADRRWLRVPGFVLSAGGVGLVALGGNLLAQSAQEKPRETARERGWLLTGIGGGLLLGGVIALSITPNKSHRVLTLAPRFSKRSFGLTLSAAF